MPDVKIKVQLFYANWCGHCNKFKPEWEQFKKLADGDNIKHEEYEADKDKQKVDEANVSGFPTIRITMNGNTEDYNGERTADAILSFVKGDKKSMSGGGNPNQCGGKRLRKSLNPSHEDYYKIKYWKYKAKYFKTKI
jgi:thiol-disulfide isomerase/thioredoxin